MNDELSIFAAAREAGQSVALRAGGRSFGFAALAELAHERLRTLDLAARDGTPYVLTGTNTLETLVTLYALLEARVPALLLHPRLTDAERGALLGAAALAGPVAPADAAAVIYTSGTTGQPRGAVLTRQAFVASARASAANLGWLPGDCWLLAMPIARVGGLSIVTRCLAARRCVALAPAFDPQALPRWVDEQRVTLLSLVPTMLARVLDAHPTWAAPPRLRAIQLGGAAASARLLQRAAERRLPIVVTYGCTETCSQVVTTPYPLRHKAAQHAAGRPLAGAEVRIESGRIQVRGPMLMAGYLGEPPRDPQAWLDTGDLGEFDAQGNLLVHARHADLIITGGENVYPAEVERVLEACPGILAAGVFGMPDETWGQVVAAALVVDATTPTDQAILDHLGARLAAFKRPRRLYRLDALPSTGAGKLDRAALLAWTGARHHKDVCPH